MSQGYTVVLESQHKAGRDMYVDTALPFSASAYRPKREDVPDRIRDMLKLPCSRRGYADSRAERFYRQAVFMQDYEDDLPWTGHFACYFPTYSDMNTEQLRGYFTWRRDIRSGRFQPISTSAAYIYIYELLNGIGTSSPEDSLRKLAEFSAGYVDAGFGDERMKQNIYRWTLDLCVINDIPPETAVKMVSPELIESDRALFVLRNPEDHLDADVFAALCCLGGKKTASSPVVKAGPERAAHLFSEAWRMAVADFRQRGKELFALIFGEMRRRQWYPLSNAVYCGKPEQEDREYILDESRSFICRNGVWQILTYERISFDLARLHGFLHETDAGLRRYLKTGRYLKENPMDAWVLPIVDAVTEADRKAVREASRPKVTIDLSGLEKIRMDAAYTRDSLLTEEDIEELPEEKGEPEEQTDLPLDNVQARVLKCLLSGGDPSGIIRDSHLMPSVAADAINEALFDEIGDSVVTCEGNILELVEDYVEDLERLLGGEING